MPEEKGGESPLGSQQNKLRLSDQILPRPKSHCYLFLCSLNFFLMSEVCGCFKSPLVILLSSKVFRGGLSDLAAPTPSWLPPQSVLQACKSH